MIENKEPKTPLWKMDGLIILMIPSLILSPIVWMGLVNLGNLLSVRHLAGTIFPIIIVFIFFCLGYAIWYRRKLYGETATGLAECNFPDKRTRCIICNRHPVSKSYHMKNVHGLRKYNKKEYFENCGCEICKPPPSMGGTYI